MAAGASYISSVQPSLASPTISCSLPSTECSRGAFRGMLKVPSLVFDIELEDNGIGGQWQDDGEWDAAGIVPEIQRFVTPASPAEARLLSDVKVGMQHAKDGQDFGRLVAILQALGYRCSLRTALGGGDGADCLRNLRHTFLTCETPAAPGSPARRYVVDVQFKEQFIIAKTTARYAAILAAIPQVFVGPEDHLTLLVNFLCNEMSTAFRQLGAVLPPWRQASSMLSKWQPRKSIDETAFRPPSASAKSGTGAALAAAAVPATAAAAPGAAVTAVLPLPHQQWQWPPRSDLGGPGHHQQQQLHHWQQAAMLAQQPCIAAASAFGVVQPAGSGGGRPSWEPQRVVFGGNFVPITPAPAS